MARAYKRERLDAVLGACRVAAPQPESGVIMFP